MYLSILVVVMLLAGISVAIYSSNERQGKNANAQNLSHFNVANYGAKGDGVTNDSSAFQSAIDAAFNAGGGIVDAPAPANAYHITSPIVLKSNVQIIGSGSLTTKITGGIPYGYTFTGGSKTVPLTNISVSGLTIDLAYLDKAGGVSLEYIDGFTADDLQINNVNQWGIVIGVLDGADTVIRNSNIIIKNSSFNGLNSTYEQLLFLNTRNVTIQNNKFSGISNPAGSAIGLYQVLDGVLIDGNTFTLPTGRGAYYSVSADNVTFNNNVFTGTGDNGNGIIGANLSDNGSFGHTVAKNYSFKNNTFKDLALGLQVGALHGGQIQWNTFDKNINALVINNGNIDGAYAPAKSLNLEHNSFINNNATNNYHIIHPAILFASNGGLATGASYVYLINNTFQDNQATKTQRYAIDFEGAYANGSPVNTVWDYMTIAHNDLWADTTSGGTSIAFSTGARLGSNTLIYENTNYSGLPTADTILSGVDGTVNKLSGPYTATDGTIFISPAEDAQGVLVRSITTDQGYYYFPLHPGNYIFNTDSNGKVTQEATFAVVKNQKTALTINIGGQTTTPTTTAIPPTLTPTPTAIPPTLTPTSLPTATPTPTAAPITVSLKPIADSYVRSDVSGSNYGTKSTLYSDGSPIAISYLKFDLTSLAGKTIKSAYLRVRTHSDASTGIQSIKTVATNSWTETGIKYTTKPTLGSIIGTINSGNKKYTWLNSTGLAPYIAGAAGSIMTLGMDQTSSDGIILYSRSSSYSPVLVITAQ